MEAAARLKASRVVSVRMGEPLFTSPYCKPARVFYRQAWMPTGEEKAWDVVEVHDGVSVLLYHVQRHAFILVKQFRPAVWAAMNRAMNAGRLPPYQRADPATAYTYELCGGLVDKGAGKSLAQHAVEEVAEETGYELDPASLTRLAAFREAVGILGNRLTVYYAEVDDSMKRSSGGGLEAEGECIEVVEVPIDAADKLLENTSIELSADLLFAVQLILQKKRGDRSSAAAQASATTGLLTWFSGWGRGASHSPPSGRQAAHTPASLDSSTQDDFLHIGASSLGLTATAAAPERMGSSSRLASSMQRSRADAPAATSMSASSVSAPPSETSSSLARSATLARSGVGAGPAAPVADLDSPPMARPTGVEKPDLDTAAPIAADTASAVTTHEDSASQTDDWRPWLYWMLAAGAVASVAQFAAGYYIGRHVGARSVSPGAHRGATRNA